MHLFKMALSLALLAGSALAQLTSIRYPPAGATLTADSNTTVQVYMSSFIENVDVVAIVIGLSSCPDGTCYPPTEVMGDILYQGPFTPQLGNLCANYTVTIPEGITGPASINVINLHLVGLAYVPVVDYLNQTVTIIA